MRKGAHFMKPEPKEWRIRDLQEAVKARTGCELSNPERMTREDLGLLLEAFVRNA